MSAAQQPLARHARLPGSLPYSGIKSAGPSTLFSITLFNLSTLSNMQRWMAFSFVALYISNIAVSLGMFYTGITCDEGDQGPSCQHYMCNWLVVMSLLQGFILQPCCGGMVVCLFTAEVVVAFVGWKHFATISIQQCSSKVLDFSKYAVVYNVVSLLGVRHR